MKKRTGPHHEQSPVQVSMAGVTRLIIPLLSWGKVGEGHVPSSGLAQMSARAQNCSCCMTGGGATLLFPTAELEVSTAPVTARFPS